MTLISSKVDDVATLNVRDLMAKTVTITTALPSEITIKTTNGSQEITLQSNESDVTYKTSSDNSVITSSVEGSKLKISTTSSTATNGIVLVQAEKAGMASWSYSILVNVE